MRANNSAGFGELLAAALKGICELSAGQLAALEAHYRLLERWNARMNLTAVRSMEEAVVRHYAESLFLAHVLQGLGPAQGRVLDLGSGAGFPGIPVAVLLSDWPVTLVEANQRKAAFLRESTRELANIEVFATRVEAVVGHWDWVISRAVRPDEVVAAARRLGQSVALLVSDEQAPVDGWISWREPIPLPWSEHSRVLLGVPRGT